MKFHDFEISVSADKVGFDVSYQGEVVFRGSRDPEADACALMRERRETGKVRTKWKGAQHYAMVLPMEYGKAARDYEQRRRDGGQKWAITRA